MLGDLKIFNPFKIDGLKRLGNRFDGGYVVHGPSLTDVNVLISYGVGYNVEFEIEFNKITDASVFAFDPTMKDPEIIIDKIKKRQFLSTIKQLRWIFKWLFLEPNLKNYKINFVEEGIAEIDSDKYKRFATHLKEYKLEDKNILLKIDVDGAEYKVFNDEKFYMDIAGVSQILLEFHDLDVQLVTVEDIMNRLALTHSLIHIHGNNYGPPFWYKGKAIPRVIEVTLLRNDLLVEKEMSKDEYPIIGLDAPCDKTKKDIVLDFFR